MKFGAHISIAGGIDLAPARAHELGCECFQILHVVVSEGHQKSNLLCRQSLIDGNFKFYRRLLIKGSDIIPPFPPKNLMF